MNSRNEILMIFEVIRTIEGHQESKQKKDEMKHDYSFDTLDNESVKGDDHSSQTPAKIGHLIRGGFNSHDECLFKILLEFLKKKFEIISSKGKLIKENKSESLVELVIGILKMRTHISLIK